MDKEPKLQTLTAVFLAWKITVESLTDLIGQTVLLLRLPELHTFQHNVTIHYYLRWNPLLGIRKWLDRVYIYM